MPAITITLDDEIYAELSEQARQRAESVEEFVKHTVEDRVRLTGEAREMARRHLDRYPRLFERLKE